MSVRAHTAAALLAGASCLAIGAATPAYALCDAYSGGCPTAPPAGGVGGGTDTPATGGGGGTDIDGGTDNPATGNEPPASVGGGGGGGVDTVEIGGTSGDQAGTGGGGAGTTSSPSTLPFTGGELIMMTALGLGAVAGGTALVVAGRRKAVAPTTTA